MRKDIQDSFAFLNDLNVRTVDEDGRRPGNAVHLGRGDLGVHPCVEGSHEIAAHEARHGEISTDWITKAKRSNDVYGLIKWVEEPVRRQQVIVPIVGLDAHQVVN